MLVTQVRHQHAHGGAVRVDIGLDAHHAASAARLGLEQLRLEHLPRAAGKGVKEAPEAALRLGRDELLEAPSQQIGSFHAAASRRRPRWRA